MSKRCSSEEWSDDDIDDSGLSVCGVGSDSPHKRRKNIESSDSGVNILSRAYSQIKSFGQTIKKVFTDSAEEKPKSQTRESVDRPMNYQSIESAGTLGMNRTDNRNRGISPERHRNSYQTIDVNNGSQMYIIGQTSTPLINVVTPQTQQIVQWIPVTQPTANFIVSNTSPVTQSVVQYLSPQNMEKVFKCTHCHQVSSSPIRRCAHCKPDTEKVFKCTHCGQVSSSPIGRCSHCKQENWLTSPVTSSGIKRLTPTKFYNNHPTTGRAKMTMNSVMREPTPIKPAVSNYQEMRRTEPMYRLAHIAQHIVPRHPELIDLDGDGSQDNSEEMATQTDDCVEIMDTKTDPTTDNKTHDSSNDSNNNSNSSANNLTVPEFQYPISTFPDWVMFGTYRAHPKSVDFNPDSIKLTNVSPNNSDTKFKYHIMIPYTEIQQILYSMGQTNPMIIIKTTAESCGKIQECMNLGRNSTNGLILDIKSKDSREHYIIIVLKEKISERFAISLKDSSLKTNNKIDIKMIDNVRAKLILTQSQTRVQSASHSQAISRAQNQSNNHSIASASSGRLSSLSPLTRTPLRGRCSDGSQSSSPSPRKSSLLDKTSNTITTIELDDDDDDEEAVENNGEADNEFNKVILIYPEDAKDAIQVIGNDIKCLNKGEFLNDNIVNFYLRLLFIEKLSETIRQRVHIFDTFFFMQLTEKRPNKRKSSLSRSEEYTFEQRYNQKLKKWTKNVNIFQKDFLIFPIIKECHWFLSIVCYPKAVYYLQKKLDKNLPELTDESSEEPNDSQSSRKPCILFMDSLGNATHKKSLSQPMREFLSMEWKQNFKFEMSFKNKASTRAVMRDVTPHVPNQNNSSDCGLFVLEYVEQFLVDPDVLVSKIVDDPRPSTFATLDWFDPKVVKTKRKQIRDLIFDKVKPEIKERLETLIDDSKLSDSEDNDNEPMDDTEVDPTFEMRVPDEPKDDIDRELNDEIGDLVNGDSQESPESESQTESIIGTQSSEL